MKTLRNQVFEYVRDRCGCEIDYPWARFPTYAVLRHGDNRKWYGLLFEIPKNKLGLPETDPVDVLNVKLDDPLLVDLLIRQAGYFPAYHISRGNWISILLDGTVPLEEITGLIDRSYRVTASRKTQKAVRPPKEWIIPANPKYYDIVHAFDHTDTILWKQGAGIKAGDTVYMYVAAPVSAVLYRCRVLETEIPYRKRNARVNIRTLMRITLERRYDPARFTFEALGRDYQIYAVRGPRGIPEHLSADLRL